MIAQHLLHFCTRSSASILHTVGMRFPIDVAHLADDGTVLRTTTMTPRRVGLPVLDAVKVLEAEAGAFRHWELAAGQVLDVRHGDDSR